MSTPYTLMRCRLKDLITCFNASKQLAVDEDRDHETVSQKPKASEIVDRNIEKGKKQEELQTTAATVRGVESPASWKSCESEEEDDYIVFHFKDDVTGGDVIEERCVESSSSRNQAAASAANRRKKHEMGKNQVGTKSDAQETDEVNVCEEHKDTLEESCNSSTSSFSFPAIQSEWPGSPVLMPRPEGNNKPKNVNASRLRRKAGTGSHGNGF